MKLPAALLVVVAVAIGVYPSTRAAEIAAKRANDWESAVRAAGSEGQVTIYATSGFEPVFESFQKRYPAIKLNPIVGRGNQLAQKVLAERRAGKYLADVYLGGIGTPYSMFYRSGLLEPIEPLLTLPENVDSSKWFQGKFHYADDEGKYIFVFEMALRSDVVYNTQLVRPEEITSYWSFLEPKWKGKIAAIDPHKTGVATSSSLSFFYYHPELGPEFLRKLFGQMDLIFSSDPRQLLDWLAVGRFSLAFCLRSTSRFRQPHGNQQASQDGANIKRLGHQSRRIIDKIRIDRSYEGGCYPNHGAKDFSPDQESQIGLQDSHYHRLDDSGKQWIWSKDLIDHNQVKRIEETPMRRGRVCGSDWPPVFAE